jgi:hypothetical protein
LGVPEKITATALPWQAVPPPLNAIEAVGDGSIVNVAGKV